MKLANNTHLTQGRIHALKLEDKYVKKNTDTSYFQCVDVVKAREMKALKIALLNLPKIDKIFFGEKISSYIKLFSWNQ